MHSLPVRTTASMEREIQDSHITFVRISILRSRWKDLLIPCSPELCHTEKAMHVFCQALEKGPFLSKVSSTEYRLASDSGFGLDSTCKDDCSLLASFASSFEAIFGMLNEAGKIGPWTFSCARMIQKVPIQRLPGDASLGRDHTSHLEEM